MFWPGDKSRKVIAKGRFKGRIEVEGRVGIPGGSRQRKKRTATAGVTNNRRRQWAAARLLVKGSELSERVDWLL